MANYYTYKDSLGSTGPYMVSGKPFLEGGLTAPANTGASLKIEFPSVTQWIHINNRNANDIVYGFSAAGIEGNAPTDPQYGTLVEGNTMSERIDVKVTEVYILSTGGASVAGIDVIAGLTDLPTDKIIDNWSGSAGV